MKYGVLGKEIIVYSMNKPKNQGSNFEFTGNKALNSIGLNQKFWFRAPDNFSNDGPIEMVTKDNWPKNGYQIVLAIFLLKSIWFQKLTNQFVQIQ